MSGPGRWAEPAPETMTLQTLTHRASRAMLWLRSLNELAQLFWFKAVLNIHQAGDGDGVTLSFGRRGDLYQSRAKFVSSFNRTEADLDDLIQCGLLVETEDGGIALPNRFGLHSQQRAVRRLIGQAAPPSEETRARGFEPTLIPGGRQ